MADMARAIGCEARTVEYGYDETLKDAQIHPEHHKGLMVRVAGYMAYFTELDKSAQDTIIYRTAHFEKDA